jgi:hypothetical protein
MGRDAREHDATEWLRKLFKLYWSEQLGVWRHYEHQLCALLRQLLCKQLHKHMQSCCALSTDLAREQRKVRVRIQHKAI